MTIDKFYWPLSLGPDKQEDTKLSEAKEFIVRSSGGERAQLRREVTQTAGPRDCRATLAMTDQVTLAFAEPLWNLMSRGSPVLSFFASRTARPSGPSTTA